MARYHLNPETGEPGECRATKTCPFGDKDSAHYDSAAAAREAYEKAQGSMTFAKPEDKVTRRGTSYSAVTVQDDKSSLMSVNGFVVAIGPGNKNAFPVKHQGRVLGEIAKRKDGKWAVEYPDRTGRPVPTAADATAALLKDAGLKAPKPASEKKPPSPPKGYDPVTSEIDLYKDIRSNSDRTVGNLRRLSTEDLVRDYNRLALNLDTAHYSSYIKSDLSAQARIKKVLAERGQEIKVIKYGEYRPGRDFSGPETYGLK